MAAGEAGAPAPATPEIPLYIAATTDGHGGHDDFDLHRSASGAGLFVRGGITLAEVRADGSIQQRPELYRGMAPSYADGPHPPRVLALAGSFPNAFFMAARRVPEGHGFGNHQELRGDVFRWSSDRWVVARRPPLQWTHVALSPWSKGRWLGLAVYAPGVEARTGFELKAPAVTAKLEVVAGQPAGPLPELEAGWKPVSLAAFPSGEIFVAGGRKLRRFAARSLQPIVDTQLERCAVRTLTASSATNVWAAGSCVARWDGSTWTSMDAPPNGTIVSLAVATDQTMWAVVAAREPDDDGAYDPIGDAATLWRRAPDGRWTQVTLAADAGQPRRVVALSPSDVWIATDHVILRTVRPAEVASFPTGPARTAWEAKNP